MHPLNSSFPRPLPEMPTTYPPGTPGKEAVMCARLKALTQLHHPADARYEGDTRPLEWVRWRDETKKRALAAASARIFDKIKAKKSLGILGNGKKTE